MKFFKIGDNVKITSVINCEFGFNPTMMEFVGRTTIITGVKYTLNRNHYPTIRYKVQIDENLYNWSGNCLEPVESKFIMKNE